MGLITILSKITDGIYMYAYFKRIYLKINRIKFELSGFLSVIVKKFLFLVFGKENRNRHIYEK